MEHLDVTDLDDDLRFRFDIGDGLREDIRPLLFKQAGDVALRAGRFVDLPRALALLDFTDHDSITDRHRERIDGSAMTHGEGVDSFDLDLVGVVVGLLEGDAAEEPGDLDVDIGVLEGAGADEVAFVIQCVEPAALGHHDDAVLSHRTISGGGDEQRDERDQNHQRRSKTRVWVHGKTPKPHKRRGASRDTAGDLRFARGRMILEAQHVLFVVSLLSQSANESIATGGGALGVCIVPGPQHRIQIVARRRAGIIGRTWIVGRSSHDGFASRISSPRRSRALASNL